NVIETVVGFAVLAIAFVFFMFAYNVGASKRTQDGYVLKANFQSVEGVLEGSDVMIAGIKIGSVKSLALDGDSFVAKAELSINKNVQLPSDSQAIIASSGLLGGKYIMITPGADENILKNNDQIRMTQSSVNLESLIGKLIYSISGGKK
ncbi:MAG: outer membrane lipid asymmetry maintenance protein MlaD, partial [Rickettsiaceae bacterium]|nr:outer membrane lipid asymmetry maintenance protein MlaD [Rickettsiaceae bacterium]